MSTCQFDGSQGKNSEEVDKKLEIEQKRNDGEGDEDQKEEKVEEEEEEEAEMEMKGETKEIEEEIQLLKIRNTSSFSDNFFRKSAISRMSLSDSMTQGPAITNILESWLFISFDRRSIVIQIKLAVLRLFF